MLRHAADQQIALDLDDGVQVSTTTKFDLTTAFTGYDPEAFQARLPILRQFIPDDHVWFFPIRNILYQRCPRPESLAWVREARKRWQENSADVPEATHRHLRHATSSPDEALEKLVYGYGGLFPTAVNAADEEKNLAVIEQSLLHKALPDLCNCPNVIDSVIYWRPDEPTPPVPPAPTE